MYTKLVVVVNAAFTVDKPGFLHNVNGLRAFRWAGQALYRACTEGVQILGSLQRPWFCTFAPVDMHGFVHSRCASQGDPGRRGLALDGGQVAHRRAATTARSPVPDLTRSANTRECGEKKIFANPQPARSQVYNQNRYTTVVVVLTTGIFCG